MLSILLLLVIGSTVGTVAAVALFTLRRSGLLPTLVAFLCAVLLWSGIVGGFQEVSCGSVLQHAPLSTANALPALREGLASGLIYTVLLSLITPGIGILFALTALGCWRVTLRSGQPEKRYVVVVLFCSLLATPISLLGSSFFERPRDVSQCGTDL